MLEQSKEVGITTGSDVPDAVAHAAQSLSLSQGASGASAVGIVCSSGPALRSSIEASTLAENERLEHEHYMELALEQAQHAQAIGEVPIGAVLVDPDGKVVATGYNRTIVDHDASAHAEIVAIRQAGQNLKNYRLPQLKLYVTLEPCCMCIMASIHARVAQVIYGTSDPRTGACGSVFNISGDPRHNHHLEVIAHVKQAECAEQLQQFFRQRRAAQKQAKEQAKLQAQKAKLVQ